MKQKKKLLKSKKLVVWVDFSQIREVVLELLNQVDSKKIFIEFS